jgi:hypothetical protein
MHAHEFVIAGLDPAIPAAVTLLGNRAEQP